MKNNLRSERLALQWSQTQLADALGVSRQTVHSIETGKYIPSTLLALKIGRLLHKQVEEVFRLDTAEEPPGMN